MVGGDDLDVDALGGGVEVLDGHPGRDDRALAREVGIDAGAVIEDADLDVVLLRRRFVEASRRAEIIALVNRVNSEAELAAARAQVSWRKETLEAWNAQKELRQRELQVADAELNHAQYRALKANGDVRAQDLTEGDFLSVLSKAKRKAPGKKEVEAAPASAPGFSSMRTASHLRLLSSCRAPWSTDRS